MSLLLRLEPFAKILLSIRLIIPINPTLGPFSQKTQKLFGLGKPFLVNPAVSVNRAVYAPEASCMKRTSVDI